ncbi:MAG: AAA-like domain-containing protein [Stenomitos rutilans HA7619-LM2]|jgi:DNA-binding CsgD family transcriptional regulator|nr:AAA-like domain-containing protein [Stenomitos rutilans HA7619-LM2]
MAPDLSQPEETFARAEALWDTSRLYADLASAKREKLTPTEKEHLRGLLLGLGPKEIAKELCKGVGGVRVALCSLYRYLEALCELPEGKINSRTVIHTLEEAGYKLGSSGTGLPTGLISKSAWIQPAPATHKAFQHATHMGAVSVRASVVISHGNQSISVGLAQQFYDGLKGAGHQVSVLEENHRSLTEVLRHLNTVLEQCDYFLLLLAPHSAVSEMVTEEVRRVREVYDAHPHHRPMIVPVRVGTLQLNHNLRGYLHGFQEWEWRSTSDTPLLLQAFHTLLTEGHSPTAELTTQALPTSGTALEDPDAPPLPVAEPELPWGQVNLVSAFYVERSPLETRCYDTIVKPGALIRIKAPRQMGKTSLMSRILYHGEQQNYVTLPLSFQLADRAIFSDLDKFLRWFCASVGLGLQLPNKLKDYWDDIFGSKVNCKAYFEQYLLREMDTPLVLGLDEVDRVFEHRQIAEDFFGLLRAWHEEAKNRAVWQKLRLVVVHSTEVYVPLDNNQSPFNVGLPIELPEFNLEQVHDLAARHGLHWGESQSHQLMLLVGGHPYLVRVALYHIAKQDMTLKQLLQNAPTEAGPYSDHLRRHLWNLEQYPDIAAALARTVATTEPVRLEASQAFKLHSMGLVHLNGNNVTLRYELYRQYFRDRLLSI